MVGGENPDAQGVWWLIKAQTWNGVGCLFGHNCEEPNLVTNNILSWATKEKKQFGSLFSWDSNLQGSKKPMRLLGHWLLQFHH